MTTLHIIELKGRTPGGTPLEIVLGLNSLSLEPRVLKVQVGERGSLCGPERGIPVRGSQLTHTGAISAAKVGLDTHYEMLKGILAGKDMRVVLDEATSEELRRVWEYLKQQGQLEFDRRIPGLSLLIAAHKAQASYRKSFARLMKDEGNDGARPLEAPKQDVEQLAQQYPVAACYLRATSYGNASDYRKANAGRRACELLQAGGKLEEAQGILDNWLPETVI